MKVLNGSDSYLAMLYLQIFRDLSKSIRPHLQREDSSVSGEFDPGDCKRDLWHLSPWNLAIMSMDNPFVSGWCPCNICHFHPFSHEHLGFPGANWDILRLVKAFGILIQLIPPHHPRDGHATAPSTSAGIWRLTHFGMNQCWSKRWPMYDFFRFLQSFTARPGAHPCSTLGVRRFHIYWWYRIQWHPMTFSVWNLLESLKQVLSYGPQVFFGGSGLHEGFALPVGLHPCAANYWY